MLGINTKFHCPNCGFKGVVDLGVTPRVRIKGSDVQLDVEECPKCNHGIAFKLDVVDFRYDINKIDLENIPVGIDLSTVDEADITRLGCACY